MGQDLTLEGVSVRHVGPVDVSVKAGRCLGLSGPSGCGKSSILRALADMDEHGGEISLGETRLSEVEGPMWRSLVGLLPSESAWWADVVADHFLNPDEVSPESLGLLPAHMRAPVKRLSSGERQRLALLRLLDRKPAALLLDEPTANLDEESTALAEALILDYAKAHRAPVIWVAHDRKQLARVADMQLVMCADGCFTEQGETP